MNGYVSLDMARRLKEAGIRIETHFCTDLAIGNNLSDWPVGVEKNHPDFVPRPSMAELWEWFRDYEVVVERNLEYETCCSMCCRVDSFAHGSPIFKNANPADALGELTLWVKEKGGK